MSQPVATYSFLPWLRQGIANKIAADDHDASVKLRASIDVELTLKGDGLDGNERSESIPRKVQLYGPGDIIGIESRAIVKTEPRNWITNFEPNYMPHVEFYDEDFPWRYTPAAPDTDNHRLRPWIALLVLKEGEFEEISNVKDKPLPFVKVTNAAAKFPKADQLWAWAHVHINRSLTADDAEIVSGDMGAVMPKFQSVLDEDPDLAYSRIVCPLRLEADAAYHAFLMPVFESGRLAGLGLEPANSPHATFPAWVNYPGDAPAEKEEPEYFPYYFRWYFRTGNVGDFEYLVRLLEPRPMDKEVGRRDMDVQDPGANLHPIDDPELGGVLKLGGALQVPFDTLKQEDKDEVLKYENWDDANPHPFQLDLSKFINLTDDYAIKSAQQANRDTELDPAISNDSDPMITAPLYGRWHSLSQRLLLDRIGNPISPDDNWVHELNLDPRFRVTAGFSTHVVQKNQEAYMNAAWEQVGEVLEANQRIRWTQLAHAVSTAWYERHLLPMKSANPQKALLMTAPVQKRVVSQGFTIYHQFNTSKVSRTVTTGAARQALRPGGRMMRGQTFTANARPENLIARMNTGEVFAAPPKTVPEEVVSLKTVGEQMLPDNAPSWIVDLLRKHPWLKFTPLVIALLILLLLILLLPAGPWWGIGAGVIAGAIFVYRILSNWLQEINQADLVLEENQTPESVDEMPKSPDFTITRPGDGFKPSQGENDSPEAVRFKTAIKDANTMLVASTEVSKEPPRQTLNLPAINTVVMDAINPNVTIFRHSFQSLVLPERLLKLLRERFQEAMAYPEIDIPMYEPLVAISSEMFLPNINRIGQNTISLLETNQRFIEAYMVGLNHEFARELLWREYPTDQRGSYFRQFWDVSGYLTTEEIDPEQLREALKDIPPLDRWRRSSKLGDHDHRETGGDKEEEVVLVIRGELLKKYPTAVIYAHRAEWQRKNDGTIDNTKERRLAPLIEAEEDNPPRTKVKTPLYEAKVDPDIYFFGFDLTAVEARGGTGENQGDDPGWFFVIKERPGEPRFGLDVSRDGDINVWNDLSWADVLPGDTPGAHLPMDDTTPVLTLVEPTAAEVQEKIPQYNEDKFLQWNKNVSSADLAYMLYQAPVLVGVHAAEMLPRE